jgi:hypothetical protein
MVELIPFRGVRDAEAPQVFKFMAVGEGIFKGACILSVGYAA